MKLKQKVITCNNGFGLAKWAQRFVKSSFVQNLANTTEKSVICMGIQICDSENQNFLVTLLHIFSKHTSL